MGGAAGDMCILKVGHAAQSILLECTALMLKARPVGAYAEGPLFKEFYNEIFKITDGKRGLCSAILVTVDEIYSLKPSYGRKKII